MGLKRFGNTSEHKSFGILDRVLRDSPADSPKPLLIFEEAHGQNLPGISMSELADHFCDFLALDRLRVWAQQNLSESSS